MKVFAEARKAKRMEGGAIHMMKEHRGISKHMPPHERKALMNVEFDEGDWSLLKQVFGDEDTAMAAIEIIKAAPPEIQILAIQLMNIIEGVV